MELLQLQYFAEVARLGNVTKAANELHVSQPALSQSIRRLENELEMKLFEKEGRNIRLTAKGQKYYAHISQALQEIETAALETRDIQLQGTVTLGSYMSLAPIMKGISSFSRLYPDINFTLLRIHETSQINPENLDALLYYEQSDSLGFRERLRIGATYRRTVLPRSPGMPPRTGYANLQELSSEPFVSLLLENNRTEEIFSEFAHSRIRPHIRYRTNSDLFKREILEAGLAVGFTNSMLLDQFNNTGSYIPASSTPPAQSAIVQIFLAWRESGMLSPAAKAFKDFMTETYQ